MRIMIVERHVLQGVDEFDHQTLMYATTQLLAELNYQGPKAPVEERERTNPDCLIEGLSKD